MSDRVEQLVAVVADLQSRIKNAVELHVEGAPGDWGWATYCIECHGEWPCDTIKALGYDEP